MNDEIKLMPHAEGSEKFVLSSFMKNPEVLELHPLDPAIFYLPSHATIYREMLLAKPFEI